MSIMDAVRGVPDVPSIMKSINSTKTSGSGRLMKIERSLGRRKLGFYRRYFPKKIPDVVSQDLERTVNALVNKEPRIEEIRLFGSYARGTFNRRESDIDLAVFVNAPEYFYTEITPSGYYEDGVIMFKYKDESDAVKELRDSIEGHVIFPGIYSVHIIANGDQPYSEDRGIKTDAFLKEIRRGKLLYPREN